MIGQRRSCAKMPALYSTVSGMVFLNRWKEAPVRGASIVCSVVRLGVDVRCIPVAKVRAAKVDDRSHRNDPDQFKHHDTPS